MTTVQFMPGHLTLPIIEQLFRSHTPIELMGDYREKVGKAAEIVERAAAGEAAVYGVNTGFGKLAHTRIPPDQTATLQRNLILSHCCGVGEALEPEIVRLIILLKLNSLARGASGVRLLILEQLLALYHSDIIPYIPAQGSVGASGDLAPLAHLTAVMIGEGQAFYKGTLMAAEDALIKAGIQPIQLRAKEGLGMINGTQVSTALALSGLFDSWRLIQSALISGAMASDAMMASTAPFREEIHALRGHKGQQDAGYTLREILSGSVIRESHRTDDTRVQDPYCMRCQPQVMGACMDMVRNVGATLEIEANAVTDNPLVILQDESILSGGNFHAEPVAFAADQMALAIAETGSITERRIATMVDPALSYGLPAFLSPNPGLNSGFMIAEVTAAALMSENKQKAAPCSTDSTPTSANQEDHVSMACHAARRLKPMNQNLATIIGIELLTSAQGISFRQPLETSSMLRNVITDLRTHVEPLGDDRYMANDLEKASWYVLNGNLVNNIHRTVLPSLAT
jgi:histidine ammonia-lyase